MARSAENRIVLSETFYLKVANDLVNLGLPPDAGCLKRISDRLMENFKGVPVSTAYRVIEVQ